VESLDVVADDYGDSDPIWSKKATAMVSIKALRGREVFQARQVGEEITHRIGCRYQPGIKSNQRIKVGDRVFEILSVIDVDERRRDLELTCLEKR
jgi:SPP1 family predicted phage head-tail adaptor